MKIERSYQNYLPLKIKLYSCVVVLFITIAIGCLEYYQIIFSKPLAATIESVEWNSVPYTGFKNIILKLTSDSTLVTLSGYKLPIFYHPGDVITVYSSGTFGYIIYDQISFFIITPTMIIGSFLLVKKFLKKEIVNINI
jgi:hypothetical protein